METTGTNSDVILETKALSVNFGGLKAVEKVDMRVRRGAIHGVIGPNGAGKTTFFNMLTGFVEPVSGTILFKGKDITNLPPHRKAELGMCRSFQNIKLFRSMSVLENVKVGFHYKLRTKVWDAILHTPAYRADEEEITEKGMALLRLIHLDKYARHQAANLAYGTQRRLEIARALASDPDILLLDEPAAGMNPSETAELTEFIREINRSGRTVVVIEHDMKLIMNLCDMITVLNQGIKICEGDALTVRNNPDVIQAYLGRSAAAV